MARHPELGAPRGRRGFQLSGPLFVARVTAGAKHLCEVLLRARKPGSEPHPLVLGQSVLEVFRSLGQSAGDGGELPEVAGRGSSDRLGGIRVFLEAQGASRRYRPSEDATSPSREAVSASMLMP